MLKKTCVSLVVLGIIVGGNTISQAMDDNPIKKRDQVKVTNTQMNKPIVEQSVSEQSGVNSKQKESNTIEIKKNQVEVKGETELNKIEIKQMQLKSESRVNAFSQIKQTQVGAPTLLWKKKFNDKIVSYSISSNGSQTVVATEKQIYCFNENGDMVWEYSTIDTISNVMISENGSYTLVQTMMLLVPNSDAIAYHLLFFNQNGELLWEQESYGEFDMSSDGEYIVSSQFMDATDTFLFNNQGKVVWIKRNIGGSPYISKNGSNIVISAGSTYCLDGNGNILWTKDGDDSSISPDGNYVATFRDDFCNPIEICLYSITGNLLWKKEVSCGGFTEFSPDSSYLLTYIDRTGFYFYATKNGALSWQKLTDCSMVDIGFTVLPNNNVVLITPLDGGFTFICIDIIGNTLWQFNISEIKKAFISADSRYIVADDGDKSIYYYKNAQ